MGRPKTTRSLVSRLTAVLRHLWPWIRLERRVIGVSMLALIAGVVLRLAEPWPLKYVLDHLLTAGGRTRTGLVTTAALALVAVIGLRAFFDFHQRIGFARIGNRVLRRVRTHAYDHIHHLSLAFHSRSRVGDLLIRMTRDVSLLRDVASTAFLPMVASWLVLTSMLVAVFFIEWHLALLSLAAIPIFLLAATRLSTGIHAAASLQRKREGQMATTAAESIQSMREVQALSVEDRFIERFAGKNRDSAKEDMKTARLSAQLARTVDLVGAVATAAVLWYGALLVTRGRMTPGDLIVFLSYLKRALKPVKDFAKHSGRLAKATAAGERVISILETRSQVSDLPGAETAPLLRGDIEFRSVRFRYTEEAAVFADLSLSVRAGERLAVMGDSGTGKSTLVHLLLRLYDPESGVVTVDGRDIRDYTLASYRPQIGVVFQDAVLFSGTVRENIAFGRDDATIEAIERAARTAQAHDFISRFPAGYDTLVGERGATLSQGQRQRIAIARALLRDTPVLVLDEPTNGLDEHNAARLVDTISNLPARITTILITHDPRLADTADRVAVLENGKLAETGTPAELRARGGAYADLWRVFRQAPTSRNVVQ